ncbi:NUDIX hydrolase [Bordetella sp. BOR01]|uniref:NUDIX hydrolase n=1 Tax=Bordetella sp. BOR01 TaxID=2854779 RepID=UPI001C468B82|nr:NUDIX hydrolase [Bordetella sp. BOR01]MBV7483697.1 NUDIX hydrolase [Bordetella sp. BOR01]
MTAPIFHPPAAAASSHDPQRPIAATIAAVVRDGHVLLVRRAHAPDAGRWAFPGGKVELGETVREAAMRELYEETCVRAQALQVFDARDVYDRGAQGELSRHYILIAVLCRWIDGEPAAGDDALDARWFPIGKLASQDLALSFGVADVARQAVELAAALPG